MTFDEIAKSVLQELITTLFPSQKNPNQFIIEHVWRDRDYVGEYHEKVVSWKGWSVNLGNIDKNYRTIFIDAVQNVLPLDERKNLFGSTFAEVIEGRDEFVVLFVLDFPKDTHDEILANGFIPRMMKRVLHACIVVDLNDFLGHDEKYWASKAVQLIQLQNRLSRRSNK